MYFPLKRILQYSFVNIIERAIINSIDFENSPPIIIYQFGKVGSTTIYKSLKKENISNQIYHIHFLSRKGINNAINSHKIQGKKLVPHLLLSDLLRRKIDNTKDVSWKIITSIREPIGFEVSNFFESLEWIGPTREIMNDDREIDNKLLVSFLEEKIRNYDTKTSYVDTWFDKEFKESCDIDVYNFRFNYEKGYSIIRKKNVEVLILRLEDLNRNFDDALTDFLSLSQPIKMVKANIGKDKKYADVYRYVKENIHIPQDVCKRIYSSKFSTHFYDEKMREGFINKWTQKNT